MCLSFFHQIKDFNDKCHQSLLKVCRTNMFCFYSMSIFSGYLLSLTGMIKSQAKLKKIFLTRLYLHSRFLRYELGSWPSHSSDLPFLIPWDPRFPSTLLSSNYLRPFEINKADYIYTHISVYCYIVFHFYFARLFSLKFLLLKIISFLNSYHFYIVNLADPLGHLHLTIIDNCHNGIESHQQ
jgi:hypothetical protein